MLTERGTILRSIASSVKRGRGRPTVLSGLLRHWTRSSRILRTRVSLIFIRLFITYSTTFDQNKLHLKSLFKFQSRKNIRARCIHEIQMYMYSNKCNINSSTKSTRINVCETLQKKKKKFTMFVQLLASL